MRRRNFLYHSGVLASAIIAAPSSVWSAESPVTTKMLVLANASANNDAIHDIIKNTSGLELQELTLEQVSSIDYNRGRFLVKMSDGKQHFAEKIIFSSYEKIDISPVSVKISNGDSNIHLGYHPGDDKLVPEFWALTRKKFDNGKILPFIKRSKPAFLCIS